MSFCERRLCRARPPPAGGGGAGAGGDRGGAGGAGRCSVRACRRSGRGGIDRAAGRPRRLAGGSAGCLPHAGARAGPVLRAGPRRARRRRAGPTARRAPRQRAVCTAARDRPACGRGSPPGRDARLAAAGLRPHLARADGGRLGHRGGRRRLRRSDRGVRPATYRSTYGLPPCTSADGCCARSTRPGRRAAARRRRAVAGSRSRSTSTRCPRCVPTAACCSSRRHGNAGRPRPAPWPRPPPSEPTRSPTVGRERPSSSPDTVAGGSAAVLAGTGDPDYPGAGE